MEHKQYVPCASFEERCAQTRTFPIYQSLWGEILFLYGHKKDLPHITCIFHLFKYEVKLFLVSAIFHHISLPRLLPKSYFKMISTINPIFCALATLRITVYRRALMLTVYMRALRRTVHRCTLSGNERSKGTKVPAHAKLDALWWFRDCN